MPTSFAPSLEGRLHEALIAARGDRKSIQVALKGEADGGAAWLDAAWLHLRRLLWEGRVGDAETTGELVASVLQATDDPPQRPMEQTLASDLAGLVSAISSVLDQHLEQGLTGLIHASQRKDIHPTLIWCASMWLSRTRLRMGDLSGALTAAEQAKRAAAELDDHAAGSVEALVGQIQRYSGNLDVALEHLNEAARLLKNTGHARALANTHLLRARVRGEMDEEGAAHVAASVAERADPNWEAPAVFRAYRALIQGDTAEAEREIAPFRTDRESTQRSPEIGRVQNLVKLTELGRVDSSVMREYCRLRDRPPNEESLKSLEQLVKRAPQFHLLRELYAWDLTKLGLSEKAKEQFHILEQEKLDDELKSSVLLGLSCLSAQQPSEEPSAAGAPATALDIEDLVLLADPEPIPDSATPRHVPATAPAPPPLPSPTTEVPSIGDLLPGKTGLTGDLDAFPLPDLVDFLRGSRRTGTLLIATDGQIGTMVLRAGQLIDASAPGAPSLQQILIETERVERSVVAATAKKHRSSESCGLLCALVEDGAIDADTARRVHALRVNESVFALLKWDAGRFVLKATPPPTQDHEHAVDLGLDTQQTLLDAVRRLDEERRNPPPTREAAKVVPS